MQRMQVQSLIQEESTCYGATREACAPQLEKAHTQPRRPGKSPTCSTCSPEGKPTKGKSGSKKCVMEMDSLALHGVRVGGTFQKGGSAVCSFASVQFPGIGPRDLIKPTAWAAEMATEVFCPGPPKKLPDA